MLVATTIFVVAPATQAEPLVCNMQTFSGEDDVAHQMSLPFNLFLGGVDHNQVYLTTNATMTFGAPDANYWSYPQTPSVSLAGYDWDTWGDGAYVSYGYNSNSFCIEWSVRPFPQSTGDLTQIRLMVNRFNNGNWHGEITTFGWLPQNLRRGIVAEQNGQPLIIEAAFDVIRGVPIEVEPAPAPTDFSAPPQVNCWDGSQAASMDLCPVEPIVTCWDGSTVHYQSECPVRTLSPPGNITGEVRADGVYISWDAPTSSATPVERYAISWMCDGCAGYGWSSTNTSVLIPFDTFNYTGGTGRNYTFSVRADNDTTSTYSSNTIGPTLFVQSPQTSIVVTSLLDDGSEGTLRWAINQANSQAGSYYDNITFNVEGTINLTSNLPNIVGQLTIDGEDKIIISGNYRIYISSQSNVFLNDLEFNMAYVENERGTLTINSSYFHDSSRSVFNKNGNTTITYINNTIFRNNQTAIASDWGGTPSIFSTNLSSYDNRIYVTGSTFENNGTAIGVERTVIVNNSIFNNNVTAISGQGINRHSITNSTFNGNAIAIQTFSWIPTSWTSFFDNSSAETNNRFISGNTFINNSYAIILGDSYNNGQRTQRGATISNNNWDRSGNWIRWYQWNGTENVSTDENNSSATNEVFYSVGNTTTSPEPQQSQSPEPTVTPSPQPSEPSPMPSETGLQPSTPSPTPTPSSSPSESQLPLPVPLVTPSPTPEQQTSSPSPEAPAPSESPTPDPSPSSIDDPSNNLTTEEAVEQILSEYDSFEAIPLEELEELGLDYSDLPPDQPVMIENGVILTAEVADALQSFENIDLFLATVLTDPGKLVKAFANVGADMTPEKRKESQQVTISVIVYAQLMNGLSAANMLMRRF